MGARAMPPGAPAWTRGLRFLATGLLNTAFGYAVYAALVADLDHQTGRLVALGLGYLPALALATVIGVAFNYQSYGRLVFRAGGGSRAFVRFVLAYAATYGFNALLLHQAVQVAGVGPYLGQALCLPLTVALSWLLLSRWVYASPKDPPP